MRLEWKYTLLISVFILVTMSILFIMSDRVMKQENIRTLQSVMEDYGKGAAMREIAGKIQNQIARVYEPELLKSKISDTGIDYNKWDVDVVDINVIDNNGIVIASLKEWALNKRLDNEGIKAVIQSRHTLTRYPPEGYYGHWVVEYLVPYIRYASPTGDETLGALQILFSTPSVASRSRWLGSHYRWLRMKQLLYVGIATVVLTVFINPLTSYLIVRRLERLMETVTAAQAGDLGVRARDSSRDEIGRISSGLNRMLERISSEHASRLAALGNLAAGVAHEVRSPLNSIAMTAQYLKETIGDNADDDTRECLDVITQQVKNLDSTVRQFLQLTCPVEMNWEMADLNAFLVDVLRSFASSMEMAKVTLTPKFSKELLYAKIDRDKMRQAISNIVANGIQAMPDGGELSVMTAWDMPQRIAIIEISDTGVGVSQENIDRLFEPYFTTKPDGIGLGLAITYRIIEAHNGEIRMESEEGQGTTFAVLLHNVTQQSEGGEWEVTKVSVAPE